MPELKTLPPAGRFAAFTEEEVLIMRAALYAMEIREISPGAEAQRRAALASRLANESLQGTPLKVPASW